MRSCLKGSHERASRPVAFVGKLLFWNRVEIGLLETAEGTRGGWMSPTAAGCLESSSRFPQSWKDFRGFGTHIRALVLPGVRGR